VSASDDIRAAIGFLTSLPLAGHRPSAAAPAPSASSMNWFPPVGAAIGWALGGSWSFLGRRFPPLAAATLVVVSDCALTGALHLDGLADSADGLLAHVPSKARLDIMAEPQVGVFGVAAVTLERLCRTAALASFPPSPALLAAIYCLSRSAMVLASRALPYAREKGLATAFLPEAGGAALGAGLVGSLAAIACAGAVAGRKGTTAVLAGWLTSAAVLALANRRLGGFTGDVLGAAAVLGETVALLSLSASSGRAR